MSVAAGWYPDGSGDLRYWDGSTWTQHTQPGGPPTGAAPARPAASTTPTPTPTPAPASAPARAAEATVVPARVVPVDAQPFAVAVRAPSAAGVAGEPVFDAAPARTVPWPATLLGVGGIALLIGSFLPWVSVFFIKVSGTDTKYGVTSAIVGAVLVLIAFQLATHRLTGPSSDGLLGVVSAVLAVVALGCVVYFGSQVVRATSGMDDTYSSSSSSSSSSESEFGELGGAFTSTLEDAVKPKLGPGFYLAGLGGILAAAGGVTSVTRRRPTTVRFR